MSVKFKEQIQQTTGNGAAGGYSRFAETVQGAAGGAMGNAGGYSKFSETIQNVTGGGRGGNGNGNGGNGDGKRRGPTGELAHEAGQFLTQGGGAKGYLQSYIQALEKNPLRIKMLTSGTLAGLQELLASWIAQDRSKHGHYLNSRIPKMAIYGALVSAPMGHFMIKILQWLFKDRTSVKAKIAMIAISNLFISPIQNTIYLTSMALIAGARTFHQVRATVRAGFWPVMTVSWISSPLALAFAQAFLPQETWVPFFNVIAFVIGTYINTITKKKRLAALRRKYSEGRSESYGGGRGASSGYSEGVEVREDFEVRRD